MSDNISPKITLDMTMAQIVSLYPDKTPAVLIDYGLPCFSCYVSNFETLEEGARAHGMSDDQIKMLIDDLNNAIG